MIYACIAICLFGGALAEVPTSNCRNISMIQDFNKTAFLGKWYKVASNVAIVKNPCNSLETFVRNGKDFIELIRLSEIFWGNLADSTLNVDDPDVSYDIEEFQTVYIEGRVNSFPKMILETDYTSYAILYTCHDNETKVIVFATKIPPAEQVFENAYAILEQKNLGDVELHREKPICYDLRRAAELRSRNKQYNIMFPDHNVHRENKNCD